MERKNVLENDMDHQDRLAVKTPEGCEPSWQEFRIINVNINPLKYVYINYVTWILA